MVFCIPFCERCYFGLGKKTSFARFSFCGGCLGPYARNESLLSPLSICVHLWIKRRRRQAPACSRKIRSILRNGSAAPHNN